MKNDIRVKRKTSFGDYEYVTLRLNYVQKEEKDGFPPHIFWRVDNGNSWNFEGLTQFLSESFESFLEKNCMERI